MSCYQNWTNNCASLINFGKAKLKPINVASWSIDESTPIYKKGATEIHVKVRIHQ